MQSTREKAAFLAAAAALIALIAWCDWRIVDPIPIGFLYLVPMFLVGKALPPLPIAGVALICTALAEAFDGFRFDLRSGIARLTLYAAAFLCMGLFVWSIERARRQSLQHFQELEQRADALREAEQQLEALIESSPAAILTADSDGAILMANEAAHRLFDAAPETLVGASLQRYLPSLANVSHGDSLRHLFRAVMRSRGVRDDREVFLADICFSTYPTSAGNRLTVMVLDASEDLRDSEEASLHQLMKGSRVVVGAMSHEIRNICAAIALAHRNLLRSPSPEVAGDLDTLAAMVDALEKVSSLELRNTNAPPVEVDLTPILEDLRIVIAPLLRDEEIAATWTVPANIPLVWGERSQFMQTFLNLANNSIHALQHAADKRFAVSVHVGPRCVQLEFLDSGGGVRQPDKLFYPFEGGTGGSGLGLYISRAFIASFGGTMSYKPVPGHACFQVELVRVGAKDDR